MPEQTSLKILGHQLGIDFEQDPLPVIIDKLAESDVATFRLSLKPGILMCLVFEAEGCKRINDALDAYLQALDKGK